MDPKIIHNIHPNIGTGVKLRAIKNYSIYSKQIKEAIVEHLKEGWSFHYFRVHAREKLPFPVSYQDTLVWIAIDPEITDIREKYDANFRRNPRNSRTQPKTNC